MTQDQLTSLKFAHSSLLDYLDMLGGCSDKENFDLKQEIEDVTSTILDLERAFPFLDIDNQNLN